MLPIHFRFDSVRETRWYEFAIRFVSGGIVTVAAGLIAQHWGPSIGGWFLAFPAILAASATLIEKHENEKKSKAGVVGIERGREAAGIDACGAAMGAVGLIAFALVVYLLLTKISSAMTLIAAMGAWMVLAFALWWIRKRA